MASPPTLTEQQRPAVVQLTPTQKFFQYFQYEVTGKSYLQEQISRLKDTGASGGERDDAVEHCRSGIGRLSKEVNDAASYTPAHDQQTYSNAITALNTKLTQALSEVAPRPKFAFKKNSLFTAQKNGSAISLNDAAELANRRRRFGPGFQSDTSNESSLAPTPANEPTDDARTDFKLEAKVHSSESANLNIVHQANKHIIQPPPQAHATSSGTLANLNQCVLDLSTSTSASKPFAGLTLKNITSSLIICGHIDGAAHITNVEDSVIVVASRQFRMHDSSNCDVYLLTPSRPIIEDCTKIRFAPLPEHYVGEHDRPSENQFENVDDFKWLKNEQSPNWSVLDPAQRVSDKVWKDLVPSGAATGVEDILRAVKNDG